MSANEIPPLRSPSPPVVSAMTPREIVNELDKHIVGQTAAKRAVALALRNRWRRQQTPSRCATRSPPRTSS